MISGSNSKRASTSQGDIAGVVLAAGESSRMGMDKPLLMYRGKTFLENIIAALRGAGVERIVVVLGHNAEVIRQRVDLSTVQVAVNHDYRRGQTSSLQTGLQALAINWPDGILMCLVDHPLITSDTVAELIQHFKLRGSPVIIPQLHGKHGHPVLISRKLFDEIAALGPDEGADKVIHKYRSETEFVEVSDPGILFDVDDPESYRNLTSEAPR